MHRRQPEEDNLLRSQHMNALLMLDNSPDLLCDNTDVITCCFVLHNIIQTRSN